MQDIKTTLTGLITAAAAFLANYGLDLSQDIQNAILYVGIIVLGFFSKDSTPNK